LEANTEILLDDRKPTIAETAYEWLQSIVCAWVICVLLFTFVGRQISVEGPSMIPTLHDGNRIVVTNLLYTPKNGDVVIVTRESFSDVPIVKRVIALAGQTVDIDYDTNAVYVDGEKVDEPYINEEMRKPAFETLDFPLTVPEGHLFIMGDNRNHSTDGRDPRIGLVETEEVLGKVLFIWWPFADFRFI